MTLCCWTFLDNLNNSVNFVSFGKISNVCSSKGSYTPTATEDRNNNAKKGIYPKLLLIKHEEVQSSKVSKESLAHSKAL